MVRTELFVNGERIELMEDISIPTTYTVQDIRQPDKRKASFTKTVVIPATRINNQLFADIYNIHYSIQSTGTTNFLPDFNPNLKASCEYYLDGILQLKGYMQLLKIKFNEDSRMEYEVSIVGSVGNVFVNMGAKKLSELSMAQYNHTYNYTNISNSWSGNYTNGYVYPMIDYGTTNHAIWNTEDFYPAVYVKTIFDKIFEENGFSYSSSFLNTTPFTKLVIPFTGDRFGLNASQITARSLRASMSTAATNLPQSTIYNLPINDDTTAPNTDPSNYWDTVNYKFSPPVARQWKFVLGQTFTFTWNFTGTIVSSKAIGNFRLNKYDSQTNQTILVDNIQVWIAQNAGAQVNNGGLPYLIIPLGGQSVTSGNVTQANLTYTTLQTTTSPTDYYFWQFQPNVAYRALQQGSATNDTDVSLQCYTQISPNQTTYVSGDSIDMDLVLSDKIKQVDFVKSIIQMFNLFIDVDKDVENKLIIEPRNDYYADGVTKNWEDKIDYSQEISFTPMGDLNARRYIWSYKSDGDYYNDLYFKKWGDVYGYKFKDVNNDFVNQETKNEVIFSPTPSVEIMGTDRIIPRIYIVDQSGVVQKKASNIRILYYTGSINTSNGWTFKDGLSQYSMATYPLVCHVDYPTAPSLDLSFGVPHEIYWNIPVFDYTPNCLYNVYYKQMIDEITDPNSKIVTAYVNLKPSDILELDFRNKFYWGGVYFRLNKVMDYNPNMSALTKCEFIKIKEGVPYTGTSGVTGIETGFDEDLTVSTLRTPQYQGGGGVNPVRQLGSGSNINAYPYADNVLLTGKNIFSTAGAFDIAAINSSGVSFASGTSGVVAINVSNKEFTESNAGETWINNYRYGSENISIKNTDYNVRKEDEGKLFNVSSSGSDKNLYLPYISNIYSGWRITVKNRTSGSGYNVNIVINEPSRYFEDGTTTFQIGALECFDIYLSDDTFYIK